MGDGTNLGASLTSSSYDLLIAIHVLEHMRDPIAAMSEWDRVLEPMGLMLLILPHRRSTYDRYRRPDTMQQLLQRHARGTASDVPPHLDPEFESVIRTWDVQWLDTVEKRIPRPRNESAPALAEARARRLLRKRIQQKGGAGLMHWHVFDFDLLVQLLECFSYKIEFMSLWPPHHQVVVASKPAD